MTGGTDGTLQPLPPFILRLRAISGIWLVGFAGALGLAATLIGAWAGIAMLPLAIPSAALCLAAGAATRVAPQALATRTLLASCLAGELMLLIAGASPLGDGAVQQAHMLYFVTNTFLTGLVCPTAMLTYNIIVVLHHLLLTFLAPALVWHTTSPQIALADLATHASIAVTLVGPLLLLSRHMMRSAVASDTALREARAAVEIAGAARERQMAAERETTLARAQTLRDVRERLAVALDSIIGSVRSTAVTISEGTDELAGSSRSVDRSAADMTRESEDSSRRMTLVAAAAEQLAASVKDVCSQTDAAARSSTDAAAQARAAEATVASLDQSAREIGTIVALISSIAKRTNLLALNATIEAACAGDAGRGFAIVAGEVKQLAHQTAHATESISRQIAEMTEKSQSAVAAIGAILHAVRAADERVAAIAVGTRHQQEATAQIAESVSSVAAGAAANANRLRHVKDDIAAVEARGAGLREAADRLNASVAAARENADTLLSSLTG